MRRVRITTSRGTKTKILPISDFRRVGSGTPSWMQSHRAMTGHHPLTGQKITDKKMNSKVLNANQRVSEPIRDFAEKDAETNAEIITQFNLKQLDK